MLITILLKFVPKGSNRHQAITLTHFPLDKMAAILADDISKCISMNEKFCILIRISMEFVPKGPID